MNSKQITFIDTVTDMRNKGFGFNLTITPDGRTQTSFYKTNGVSSMCIIKGLEECIQKNVAEAAKVATKIMEGQS